MTTDEVLAFTNFEVTKQHAAPRVNACFHGAFALPGTPPDAEPRQSTEHRVMVFLLRS